LTGDERASIQEAYKPLGFSSDSLTTGQIRTSETTLDFLSNLSGHFKKDEDRPLGYKILDHAEQVALNSPDVLANHFFYQSAIEMHYRDRSDPAHLGEAVRACRAQIEIAKAAAKAFKKESPGNLPEHVGYKQLAIILAGQGLNADVASLARQAKNEGWSGDWDRRIAESTEKKPKVATSKAKGAQ
jgi:hypothetical protein